MANLFRILLFILVLFWGLHHGKSQITYPIDLYDGDQIGACEGYFVDSGGDTLTVYQPGEDYSITFCSNDDDKPFIRFFFNFFELAEGDILYVYDGENDESELLYTAQKNDLANITIWFSGECAHFRFISQEEENGNGEGDDNGEDDDLLEPLGWFATISCYTFCDGLWVEAKTTTSSFNYCPYDPKVYFEAEAGYQAANIDYDAGNFVFTWNFQGDIQTGQYADQTYDNPGAYPFSLAVEDTENTCEASAINVVKIGTYPDLSGTYVNPDTICARGQTILVGEAEATIWAGFPTSVDGEFPIPDGTGESFVSTLEFDVFEPLAELEDENDFDRICINIEHVDYGQLRIELECPNGSSVVLADYSPGGANLGEPVVWDNFTPGVGYDYCFCDDAANSTWEESPHFQHEYTDNAGNYYFNANYLPAGSYTPIEPFSLLSGCPLNGEWTLTVTDNAPGDNGFIFQWSLFFNEDVYPDSLIFIPNITEVTWYDNGTALEGDRPLVSKEDPGEYEFVFEVKDDFGCVYDTVVYLEVLPLPNAEIISEYEIPVCEGDSTIFTVVPVDDNPYNWIYQWEYNLAIMEGSIYDTIMAKETGIYAVLVTDTVTTCSDFFELEFTDQNCDLVIPNVFTPNGDGINDYFEILNLEHYPDTRIVIFNRNGKKVFEHHNYDGNWWDGKGAPDGTYFYVLYYKRMGKQRQIHGAVTILR